MRGARCLRTPRTVRGIRGCTKRSPAGAPRPRGGTPCRLQRTGCRAQTCQAEGRADAGTGGGGARQISAESYIAMELCVWLRVGVRVGACWCVLVRAGECCRRATSLHSRGQIAIWIGQPHQSHQWHRTRTARTHSRDPRRRNTDKAGGCMRVAAANVHGLDHGHGHRHRHSLRHPRRHSTAAQAQGTPFWACATDPQHVSHDAGKPARDATAPIRVSTAIICSVLTTSLLWLWDSCSEHARPRPAHAPSQLCPTTPAYHPGGGSGTHPRPPGPACWPTGHSHIEATMARTRPPKRWAAAEKPRQAASAKTVTRRVLGAPRRGCSPGTPAMIVPALRAARRGRVAA